MLWQISRAMYHEFSTLGTGTNVFSLSPRETKGDNDSVWNEILHSSIWRLCLFFGLSLHQWNPWIATKRNKKMLVGSRTGFECFLARKWFHEMTIFDTCNFYARTGNMPQERETTRFGWWKGMEEMVWWKLQLLGSRYCDNKSNWGSAVGGAAAQGQVTMWSNCIKAKIM